MLRPVALRHRASCAIVESRCSQSQPPRAACASREYAQEKPFWVVAALPETSKEDPLLLITSLPIRTFQEAQQLVKLYERHWGIETAF